MAYSFTTTDLDYEPCEKKLLSEESKSMSVERVLDYFIYYVQREKKCH
jgi:hypothetical protein